MKPLRLYMENFMNHKKSEIDFSLFNAALIVGKNKDNARESNGIGKTSIFSAIEYALFGEVPTSVLEKIIRNGTEKCLVEFAFETELGKFKITRGRSRKGRSELRLHEWVNNDWQAISERGMPETNKKINELVKISHKAFSHSIKFGQNDLSGLASVDKPEKRKAILKEPLQLSDFFLYKFLL